jgi:hypothetical protein
MSGSRVVVKYHNRRMFLTIDIGTLFCVLFDAFGDALAAEFVPMSETERAESIEETGLLPFVRERFRVFERKPNGALERRIDVETAATRLGQK